MKYLSECITRLLIPCMCNTYWSSKAASGFVMRNNSKQYRMLGQDKIPHLGVCFHHACYLCYVACCIFIVCCMLYIHHLCYPCCMLFIMHYLCRMLILMHVVDHVYVGPHVCFVSCDLWCQDSSGMSLSMLAAAGGQDDILRLLIRKGVRVNGRQKNGTTALMHAAEKVTKN